MAMKAVSKVNNYFKFEEAGDLIEGYYLGAAAGSYEGEPTVIHNFRLDDGKVTFISGTKLINERLGEVAAGTRTRVTYEGDKKKKTGKGTYRSFLVESDSDDITPVAATAAAAQPSA